MSSSDVTLRSLALGAADTYTGWYAKTFSDSTISMPIVKGPTTIQLPQFGYHTHYAYSGFTTDPISEGDEVLDAASRYYEIKSVTYVPYLDSLAFYECELSYIPMHADRPSTSGTWHLDSSTTVTDVRYRQKLWLQTYLTPASITKDDGTTQAPYAIQFAYPDYPLAKNFVNKANYLLFFIDTGESETIVGYDHQATHYHETVPIELVAVNKTDCTATNVIEKGYQELRRIAESYPTGSIRRTGRMTTTTYSLGSTIMFAQKYIVEYTRGKA